LAQSIAVHRRLLLPALLAVAFTSLCSGQKSSAPARSSPATATTPEAGMPVLENYDTKEVDLFPEAWAILQDRRGVMYFGISGGAILEFDGVTWRKIFTPASVVRSLAIDDSGRIWVGANEEIGYLEPDASGAMHYVSLLDRVPADQRGFTSVWQTPVTTQGVFFRAYELLFRWDGKSMKVWSPTMPKGRFQALSAVRGHIYTAQTGIGLQEIVGDEFRNAPGGGVYKDEIKLFLHPFDEGRMLVSMRDQQLTLYDGQKVTPFPTQADQYLKEHKIYTSIVLADGNICLTTLTGGAVIVSHDGKLIQIVNHGAGLDSSDL
jgi:hypothetical protein